ncbi:hypothetical protein GEMRC1_014107 [Eukaryota sp. GEM-RC1]
MPLQSILPSTPTECNVVDAAKELLASTSGLISYLSGSEDNLSKAAQLIIALVVSDMSQVEFITERLSELLIPSLTCPHEESVLLSNLFFILLQSLLLVNVECSSLVSAMNTSLNFSPSQTSLSPPKLFFELFDSVSQVDSFSHLEPLIADLIFEPLMIAGHFDRAIEINSKHLCAEKFLSKFELFVNNSDGSCFDMSVMSTLTYMFELFVRQSDLKSKENLVNLGTEYLKKCDTAELVGEFMKELHNIETSVKLSNL